MDELEIPSAGPSKPAQNDPPAIETLGKLDAQSFDIGAYQGSYKGRALITRYQHMIQIASTHPRSSALAQLASMAVYKLIKDQTWDHQSYLAIMTRLEHLSAAERKTAMEIEVAASTDAGWDGIRGEVMGVPDMEWVEEVMEKERKETARLDVELRGYMSNLIKESIRLTYLASAELALRCGNSHNATKNYLASREYSTSPQHHLDLGLGILNIALAFNLPSPLAGQLARLESYLDRVHPAPTSANHNGPTALTTTADDIRENREREARGTASRQKIVVKMRVAKGVFGLGNRDYERAGREFGMVGEDGGLGAWEGQAISTSDVCLITALCVLATGSRDTVRHDLLDRPSFRIGLDDTQSWILDLIRAFMDAQYGTVSSLLAKQEPHILLNPFLYPHTTTLIRLIRTRSMVQYVEPFSSIRIDTMSSAFAMTLPETLKVIEGLISEGKINGHIDLIDMVLSIQMPNLRNQVYDRAIKVGEQTLPQTHAALIRMKLHEAGISVDPRVNLDKQDTGGWAMGPTDSSDMIDVNGGAGPIEDDELEMEEMLSSDGEVEEVS